MPMPSAIAQPSVKSHPTSARLRTSIALREPERTVDAGDRAAAQKDSVAVEADRDLAVAPQLHALARDIALAEALRLSRLAQVGRHADVAAAADRILRNAVRRRERANMDRRLRAAGGAEYGDAG